MLTPDLLTYISSQLSQGIDKQTITNSLTNIGWNINDVNEAFSLIENRSNPNNAQPPPPNADSKDFAHFFEKPKTGHGWKAVHYYEESNAPKIIKWIMKYSGGMIKTERQATVVVIGIVILCFVGIIFSISTYNTARPPKGYEGNIPNLPIYKNPPKPGESYKLQ